ncbi:MAG: peptide deformylase [Acutalibacteraceae bacterium]
MLTVLVLQHRKSILRRVVVIDIGEGLVELVNPEIIYEEGEQEMQEGCLSCPGVYGMTKRLQSQVSAQNRNGERFEFEAKNCLQ